MANTLKIVVERADELSHDLAFQKKVLQEIAKSFGLTVSDDLHQMQTDILAYEHEGLTGFDCGIVKLELPEFPKSDFVALADQYGWYKPVGVEVSDFGNSCVSLNLAYYPLNVQSMTIKSTILHMFVNELPDDVNYRQYTLID